MGPKSNCVHGDDDATCLSSTAAELCVAEPTASLTRTLFNEKNIKYTLSLSMGNAHTVERTYLLY